MSLTIEPISRKIIHVSSIFEEGIWYYLFLRKDDKDRFSWFQEIEEKEISLSLSALSVEEAMRLAQKKWKNQSFRTLICGFRYLLPERDEHGINALFHQMVASYSSNNGTYFDEELGNNCYVQNASEEALKLWKRLKSQKRLV